MSDPPSLPILIEEPVTGPLHHSAAFPRLPSIITGRCRSRAACVMQFRTQASLRRSNDLFEQAIKSQQRRLEALEQKS